MKRVPSKKNGTMTTGAVSAFRDDALGTMDATALAERIAAGEISALEAVEAAMERARAVNPRLNAIVSYTFDRAREEATRGLTGPFAGVPIFIKDNDDAPGAPTLFGSFAVRDKIKSRSSRFTRQLLSTGLVSLGKSALPEFGLTATTEPLLTGPTRNPWNTGHSTGGSSGGSAALVASGVVPMAHGNDGGGSIRIPAACCGLVGLKPTRGRLAPMEGTALMPIRIPHQGVLTRTVRDTARFYMAAERYRRNRVLPEIGLVEGPGKKRLRIGLFTDRLDRSAPHPEATALTVKTGALCERLGHSVELMPNPIDSSLVEDFLIYWGMMAFSITHFGKSMSGPGFDKSKLDPWTKGMTDFFWKNKGKTASVIRRLKKNAMKYDELFLRYDLLLCPTVGHPVPEIGHLAPDLPFDTAMERIVDFSSFTPAQNVRGAPAISLPMGFSKSGLPMGAQFAAPWGMERTLLELAFEIEEAGPWPLITGGGTFRGKAKKTPRRAAR